MKHDKKLTLLYSDRVRGTEIQNFGSEYVFRYIFRNRGQSSAMDGILDRGLENTQRGNGCTIGRGFFRTVACSRKRKVYKFFYKIQL